MVPEGRLDEPPHAYVLRRGTKSLSQSPPPQLSPVEGEGVKGTHHDNPNFLPLPP